MTLEVVSSLSGIPPGEWNHLAGEDPFLKHEFLDALHTTGCACDRTGWAPVYLLLRDNGRLAAALPLYAKSHSYGEYVFDWAWADAYERHGLRYYPKLLSAIPFTPVTGARLLATNAAHRDALVRGAIALAGELGASSFHCLFPTAVDAEAMTGQGMMLRRGLQFHWQNAGYADFESFLAALSREKRKKIRQERRKVAEAGVRFEWIEGGALNDAHWEFFTRCYENTYREHHSTPYLNLRFFRAIGRSMPGNLLLVTAHRDGRPIAASLNVRNATRLWGRYWGAVEHIPALHFETCYYQVIEYCIANRIQVFEGGAQGQHKMARGLMPVETRSCHWLAHPEFGAAVEQFLSRETAGIARHLDELNERSPFRDARDAGVMPTKK